MLQRNKFFVESPEPEVLRQLLQDDVIARARVPASDPAAFHHSKGHADAAAAAMATDLTTLDLTQAVEAAAVGASAPAGAAAAGAESGAGRAEAQGAVPGVVTGESAIGELSEEQVDLHSFEIYGSHVRVKGRGARLGLRGQGWAHSGPEW